MGVVMTRRVVMVAALVADLDEKNVAALTLIFHVTKWSVRTSEGYISIPEVSCRLFLRPHNFILFLFYYLLKFYTVML